MGSGVTGDFAKLNALVRVCGEADDIKLGIASSMANWMDKRIAQSFWTHRDPQGKTWPARKQPDRRSNVLMVDTAALMTGFVDQISADGVTICNDVPYARFLQDGTRFMPARPMLPKDADLGEWLIPLASIALRAIEKRILGDSSAVEVPV